MDWCYSGSIGASRGILLMWDRKVVEKLSVWGLFLVTCSFRNVDDNFEWAFTGVYDPNVDNWDELVGLLSWWKVLWCIGGVIHYHLLPE